MPISPENRRRYPDDWTLRSYFVRFIRAGGRCEWCDAVHGAPHPVTGSIVVLTTAHVHDRRPEVADLLNLAALCQRCHLQHDRSDNCDRRRSTLRRRRLRRDRLAGVRYLFGGCCWTPRLDEPVRLTDGRRAIVRQLITAADDPDPRRDIVVVDLADTGERERVLLSELLPDQQAPTAVLTAGPPDAANRPA